MERTAKKHTTKELYRCSSTEWARMPYEEALIFRMVKAREVMNAYKRLASNVPNKIKSKSYLKYVSLYTASEDAYYWNLGFLYEIKKDRKNEYKNRKKTKWKIFSKWINNYCEKCF